jgi:hypothetical protein
MSDEPFVYDPRIATGYTVWHKDPNCEALVNDIITKLKPDRFVETGTHMAWTLMYIAKRYPDLPIYSAEIDQQYFASSVHNSKPYPLIRLFNMNSPDFLKLIYNELKKGLSFFWLDAHWWQYVPLRDECKIVATLDKYVALVDDFASNDPRFGGDVFAGGHENNLTYLADILGKKCYVPNYESLPPDHKGYGLFLKGVKYEVPKTMREETVK